MISAIFLTLGWVFGLFQSAQIIYPFTVSYPRFLYFRQRKMVVNDHIPYWRIFIPAAVGVVLAAILVGAVSMYARSHISAFVVGYAVAAVMIAGQSRNIKNLEDFNVSYGDFLITDAS
jgi:membrane associated rhomboid family serine protease